MAETIVYFERCRDFGGFHSVVGLEASSPGVPRGIDLRTRSSLSAHRAIGSTHGRVRLVTHGELARRSSEEVSAAIEGGLKRLRRQLAGRFTVSA